MAATLTGTIKVEVIGSGSFGVGVYTGDFSYDDTQLTKVGTETMTINGGNGDRAGLLSLNFRFLDFATGLMPVTYTAKDDAGFPNGPVLAFQDGIPTDFSFLVDPGNNGGTLSGNSGLTFGSSGLGSFMFAVRNGTTGGEGRVTLELDKPTPVEPPSVPESSSPFASLLATLGLGVHRLWRKSRMVIHSFGKQILNSTRKKYRHIA
ncbi:MAG: hypothetical protein HC916_10895 [Coleofasciculaceae cyanobacterium SM2_1_6]|nr:hypothetical protein [Coleofasciculaceae cyanobacterium SM2_1_6]